MEFDERVISYEEQPFHIRMALDDGIVHKYTPDFLVQYDQKDVIVEIKPQAMLDRESTIQQITIGNRYAERTDYYYKVITDREIREGARLYNLTLIYYYRMINLPEEIRCKVRKIFATPNLQLPFGEVAERLYPQTPGLAKPYLCFLMFHHILGADLDQKLSDESLLSFLL